MGAFLFYPFSLPPIPSLSPPPPPAHAAHPRAHAPRIRHRRRSGLRFRRGFEGASRSDRAARAQLAPCFWFALICGWLRALRPDRGEASAVNRGRPSKIAVGCAQAKSRETSAFAPDSLRRQRRIRRIGDAFAEQSNGVVDKPGSTLRNGAERKKRIGKGGESESIGAVQTIQSFKPCDLIGANEIRRLKEIGRALRDLGLVLSSIALGSPCAFARRFRIACRCIPIFGRIVCLTVQLAKGQGSTGGAESHDAPQKRGAAERGGRSA